MTTETDVLILDASQAVKGYKDVEKAAKDTHEAQKSMTDFMKKDMEQAFFSAQAQYDLLKKGAAFLFDTLKTGIKDYLESVQVGMRLTAVMKAAGNESASFREKLDAQATAMERLVGVQDEEVTNLQAMLKVMGVADKDLERVTEAAYRMAQATGVSATNAARLLARASAENKEELKKFGITVKDTANEAEGFAATLLEVERRFPPLTEQIPPQVVAVNQLKGAWNSFSEALGHFAVGTVAGKEGGIAAAAVAGLDAISDELNRLAEKSLWEKVIAGPTFLMDAIEHALDKPKIEAMKKAFDSIFAGRDPNEGKVNLGTLPAFDISKEMEKQKAAAKKAIDTVREITQKQAKGVLDDYEAMIAKQDAMRDEAARIAAADRAAEQAVMDAEREFENAQGISANEDKLEREREYQANRLRIIEEAQENEKRLTKEFSEFAKDIGRTGVQFAANLLKEALLNDTAYTRAYREQILQQMTAGKTKEEADRIRHETETKWHAEGEAALLKQTSAILADIAAQAAVKAAFEAAEGIAAAAGVYTAAKAPGHFAAAAAYGAIAVGTGLGAYALSSTRGMTAEENASLEANKKAFEDRNKRDAKQEAERGSSVGSITNVYYMGITGQTEAQQGAELERIRQQYEDTKTGG